MYKGIVSLDGARSSRPGSISVTTLASQLAVFRLRIRLLGVVELAAVVQGRLRLYPPNSSIGHPATTPVW